MTGDSLVGRLRQKATDLRDLDAAATPGPWLVDPNRKPYPQGLVANDDGLVLVAETFVDPAWAPTDLWLIAAARPLPALVADLIDSVLDKHKPVEWRDIFCGYCQPGDNGTWPCPDVLALTPFLGEPE